MLMVHKAAKMSFSLQDLLAVEGKQSVDAFGSRFMKSTFQVQLGHFHAVQYLHAVL